MGRPLTRIEKNDELSILFSSAGRRVALINCFRNAAEQLGVDLAVVTVDMDPAWSPACQVADISYGVERCTSTTFVSQMLEICQKEEVDLIVPTIDTELMIYGKNRLLFLEAGTDIHLGEAEFVAVARDKEATASILKRGGIPVPESWSVNEAKDFPRKLKFPLLLKPKGGSCSKGISIISSIEEFQVEIDDRDDYLVQEICSGLEYTINCFYDRNGECVSCVPHFRKFVRDGEVCFAQTERIPEFKNIAQKFSRIFHGIRGCICFQGFRGDDGAVQVFEINARFGGGYPICDRAGGTYARWILQDLMGQQPDYHDDWKEGVRMLRYDEAVFTEV